MAANIDVRYNEELVVLVTQPRYSITVLQYETRSLTRRAGGMLLAREPRDVT
jgi:hypothetical protein